MLKAFFILPIFLLVSSCATLMVSENRISGSPKLKLKESQSVQIKIDISPEIVDVVEANRPQDSFKSFFEEKLLAEFEELGIEVVKSSPNKLHVKFTDYDEGVGFLRFISFGGASELTAQVSLKMAKKRRRFELQKTGSKSGPTQVGDQTDENLGYFATKLAGVIVSE